MGVVYKARDTRLDRDVALKFLPPHLVVTEEDEQRFIREAKAAAALNHPNICTIYSVEEHEGAQFISMEYIDGVILREALGTERRTTETAIRYAIQIAEALEEAHSKGIVHRDIKPENIMIDVKNRVKVMDFGLAKLKGAINITQTACTAGTVAYMSPEQIQGQDVDHRADIFSFGVLLYEMLAGHAPFCGEHEAAMIYSILNEQPQPISSSRFDISSQLENLIERTLEKDPSDRYQSMADLLSDLRRLKRKTSRKLAVPVGAPVSPSTADGQRSIAGTRARPVSRAPRAYIAAALAVAIALAASYAIFFRWEKPGAPALNPNRVFVAAFENRTGDDTLDPIGRLMSDWITQGILHNELAEVIPTTTMLQMIQNVGLVGGGLEDRAKLIELAQATNSGILVSGMFYLVGRDIQFHAQIIDAQKKDAILALEPVRGPRDEPMKAINNLQRKIMGAMAIHVFPGSDISMVGDPPVYEAYLECMEGNRYFGVDYERAFEHYRRAIEIDREYLQPRLRLATGYGNIGRHAKADSILQTIDRENLRYSPYERYMLNWFKLSMQGRLEESFAALLHLESIYPLEPVANYLVGLYALHLNRPALTVETFAKMDVQEYQLEYQATSWGFGVLCSAHHLLGNHRQELGTARVGQQYYPHDLSLRADEVCALAALGEVEELHGVIEACKRIESRFGSVGGVMLEALLELRAHGNMTEALQIAEQAVRWHEEHDPGNKRGHAYALYCAERWDESSALWQELAAEDPGDIVYQGQLGALAARRGDEEEARRIAGALKNIDREYLFGLHTYQRARIHALLGEQAEAVALIQESLSQGRRFGLYMHRDIDLEPLRDYPPFKELLKPKG